MAIVEEHWPDNTVQEEDDELNVKQSRKRRHNAIYDDEDLKTTLILGKGTGRSSRKLPMLKQNRTFAKDIKRQKRGRDS